jgi:hypothetical protein
LEGSPVLVVIIAEDIGFQREFILTSFCGDYYYFSA